MTDLYDDVKALRSKYKRKKPMMHTPPELWEITTDDPAGLWQLAQLSGISSWTTETGVVLSGIDQMEAIRFLRQHRLMDEAELDQLTGGEIGGHKSLGHGAGCAGGSCPISADCERDDRFCTPAE